MGRQLVVCATRREADAVLSDLGPAAAEELAGMQVRSVPGVVVATSGIGMAEAAAVTAALLAAEPLSAVFSIGVAGGHDVPLGAVTIGATVTRADTGVELADGTMQTTGEAIGLGESSSSLGSNRAVLDRLPDAREVHVLTVATVTGTAGRAARILARRPQPGPAVEDMEAWGVHVAARGRLPFVAVKAVSNAIGPRDRGAWDLEGALAALSKASAALFSDPIDWPAT